MHFPLFKANAFLNCEVNPFFSDIDIQLLLILKKS